MEAYEMLEKVFYFRNKRNSNIREEYKITDSDKHIFWVINAYIHVFWYSL